MWLWPFRKKKPMPIEVPFIDFDKPNVRVHDSDPTALFLKLASEHGVTSMTWDSDVGRWLLKVGDRRFSGKTQVEVLEMAVNVLDG